MEMLIVFTKLAQAVSSYNTLKNFFVGGEFVVLLNEIGDAHSRAAARALEDKLHSTNPEREVESAITSLREAYETYPNYENKSQAAAAIALCYYFLGDHRLTAKYLEISKEAFHRTKNIHLRHAKSNRGMSGDNYSGSAFFNLIYGMLSPIDKIERKWRDREAALDLFVSRCS
jgi:tetratricopeptide (TPR) repeat protein